MSPADSVVSVRFQPEGLRFARPARLTLDYSTCPLVPSLLPKRIAYTSDLLRILELLPSLDDVLRRQVSANAKRGALEDTFLAVVRDWGQSIEPADSYTHGHCERVAGYALEVARDLGLEETQQTTIRLGAYLHDVGKVRVPHEILNKPGALTRDELEVMRMHRLWGIELLATVDFPWDIKPIVRWHHERYDGSGYPDRLRGDEIPLSAQIICIVDAYDAMTTTHSYRGALPHGSALEQIRASRGW